MQRIPRQIRLAFFPVFAIALALAFFLIQARVDLLSLSTKYVVINAALAILVSLAATILLLVGYFYVASLVSKTWRRLLVRITLHTLTRAMHDYVGSVQALGVGEREGSVVVRLAIGSSHSVAVGSKVEVLNVASRERWGVLEVMEVEEDSCLCRVFDRIKGEFWEELESRSQRDPSPPAGVTFSREVSEGLLTGVREVLQRWGG